MDIDARDVQSPARMRVVHVSDQPHERGREILADVLEEPRNCLVAASDDRDQTTPLKVDDHRLLIDATEEQPAWDRPCAGDGRQQPACLRYRVHS